MNIFYSLLIFYKPCIQRTVFSYSLQLLVIARVQEIEDVIEGVNSGVEFVGSYSIAIIFASPN